MEGEGFFFIARLRSTPGGGGGFGGGTISNWHRRGWQHRFALLAQPRKIIAVDLEPQPLTALTEFADAHGLSDVVRPFYGVDQSDSARLTEIVEAELGDTPLDLVIDDASHYLEPTRSSFETFPAYDQAGSTWSRTGGPITSSATPSSPGCATRR